MCMALLICILKIIFGGAAEIICVVQVMKSAPCKMFSEKDKRHNVKFSVSTSENSSGVSLKVKHAHAI